MRAFDAAYLLLQITAVRAVAVSTFPNELPELFTDLHARESGTSSVDVTRGIPYITQFVQRACFETYCYYFCPCDRYALDIGDELLLIRATCVTVLPSP